MPFSNGIPDLTTLYDTRVMMGLFEDIRRPQNFWRTLKGASAPMIFDTESVIFEKIYKSRKAAPYVRPLSDGVPSFDVQSEVRSFKPAFIKLNDTVGPQSYVRKQPGQLTQLDNGTAVGREAARVAEILLHQRDLIDNRMEQMAAEIMLTGQLVIEGPEYPARVLDFNRDPSLDLVLAPIERWDQPNVDIITEIGNYARTMEDIQFGGTVRRIVMGARAAQVFLNDAKVRETLSTDIRNSPGDFNIGPMAPQDFSMLGRIAAGEFGFEIEFWVNRQKMIIPDPADYGNQIEVNLMDQDTILLIAGDYEAVEAYGLIPNAIALGVGPTDILTRSWIPDGANLVRHVMTETAPIMVPIHENKTMRVKVL
jgi:hypothetical protein